MKEFILEVAKEVGELARELNHIYGPKKKKAIRIRGQ